MKTFNISDQWQARSRIFVHQDGISITSMIDALRRRGVLNFLLDHPYTSLSSIIAAIGDGNEGYLNVALRLLAGQGWLKRIPTPDHNNLYFSLSDSGKEFIAYSHYYSDVNHVTPATLDLLQHRTFTQSSYIDTFLELYERSANKAIPTSDLPFFSIDGVYQQVAHHIDGVLFGPFIFILALKGSFNKQESILDIREISRKFNLNIEFLKAGFFLMERFGWCSVDNDIATMNKSGLFATETRRAMSYGMILSYLPSFVRMDDILFGNFSDLWPQHTRIERHVLRDISVISSGSGHKPYFKRLEPVISDIFNTTLESQPYVILDMGCGDGSLLSFIYQFILEHTKRGQAINDGSFPLLVIGADYNDTSQSITKDHLTNLGIPNEVMFGDVNDPARLSIDLQEKFGIDIRDVLHIRSFIDHNRSYVPPISHPKKRNFGSRGTFADNGRIVAGDLIIQSYIEHLSRWRSFIDTHGILIIEHHIVSEEYSATHLGFTISTSHDSIHGWSDQYSVEYDVWMRIAQESGLKAISEYEILIPNQDAPNISMNYFVPITNVLN